MDFKVGDTVVHRSYGLGEIVQLDEKELSGKKAVYYVVKVHDLTLWTPADGSDETSLRPPTARSDIGKIKAIFQEANNTFSNDRFERRNQLRAWMKDGALESFCRVVRDLTSFGRSNKMNDYDTVVLKHASDLLLDELHYVLAIPLAEAEKELNDLLLPVAEVQVQA